MSALLYDGRGRVIRQRATSPWPASGTGRRSRAWQPTSAAINALLGSGDVELLRRRSRDAMRGNPWAISAQEAWVSNAVGTGFVPRPRTEDDEFRREILEAWEEWATDEADADGQSSFYGLQEVIARAEQDGGDAFVRLRPRRPSDGLSVPLQLQVLEAEMCDSALNRDLGNGRKIKAGIELDALGRRRFYHMFRDHPGEAIGMHWGQTRPVPADQVIHVYRVLRPGQLRGVPALSSVLAKLKEIEEADDAYILRQKIRALYCTFEQVPADDSASVLDDGDAAEDHDDVELVTPEPGSHTLLPPGHTVEFAKPPSDAADHSGFIRTELRAIAVGRGVTYEQLTGDLTGVNFSSIRAGLIEFRRRIKAYRQNVIVFQLCRRVWRRWLEAAVLVGRVQVPDSERPRLRALMRAEWTATPGDEYVDPEKEVKSIVRAIRAGLLSRSEAVARYGLDAEQLDREIRADQERERRLGLVFDTNPGSDRDGGARAAAVGGAGDSGDSGEEGRNAA